MRLPSRYDLMVVAVILGLAVAVGLMGIGVRDVFQAFLGG